MGCMTNEAPPAPNYGQVTRDTLQAQVDVAPQQYQAESTYQPQYANLDLSTMNTLLNGGSGGPGMLEQLANANNFQRQADINDVRNLGPQATQAMLAADPYNATLLAKLNAQANQGLDAGSGLTADQQRAMQQSSRAAFAARGMGGSNAAVGDEMMKQFNLGQQLLTQRQQFAQSVLGNNQAVIGDPFAQITGRSSGAVSAAQQSQSQAGPSIFNPQAGLALAGSNYGVQTQFDAAQPTKLSQIAGANPMKGY